MERKKQEEILFNAFYEATRGNLPIKCSCGREYATEREFLDRTDELECGHTLPYEDSKSVVVIRNCACGSTQSIKVDDPKVLEDFDKDKAKLAGNCVSKLIVIADYLRKGLDLDSIKTKYLNRALLKMDGAQKKEFMATRSISCLSGSFFEWMALDDLWIRYEKWLPEEPRKQRVLISDYEERNSGLGEIYLGEKTRSVYRTSLEDTFKEFAINPEDTAAIFVEPSDESERVSRFIADVKNYGKNRGLCPGDNLLIVGIQPEENRQYYAFDQSLVKPYTVDDFKRIVSDSLKLRQLNAHHENDAIKIENPQNGSGYAI